MLTVIAILLTLLFLLLFLGRDRLSALLLVSAKYTGIVAGIIVAAVCLYIFWHGALTHTTGYNDNLGPYIGGSILLLAMIAKARSLWRGRKAEREYAVAVRESEQMTEFVGDNSRVARWKAAQLKCQFFASAYIRDKASGVSEIVNRAEGMLEGIIQKVLAEADAAKDDEYCRSAILHSLVECMCKVGQFERAKKLSDLITVDIIRENAVADIAKETERSKESASPMKLTTPKSSGESGDTGKPNILIILPAYYLMKGEEPFADMATNYNDPKLDVLSVYTTLYKVFCYNKFLLSKFGKDIYYSTILEKQREKIAANSLETSEEFTLLMRMFHELDEINTKESNSDLENLIAFALINKEKEFLNIKNDEAARVDWMMRIANILKAGHDTMKTYFENCWKNSGFSKDELEAWLTKTEDQKRVPV